MYGQLEKDIKKQLPKFYDQQNQSNIHEDFIHHASKYHDPSSPYYIGNKCVSCPWSKLEDRLRFKYSEE